MDGLNRTGSDAVGVELEVNQSDPRTGRGTPLRKPDRFCVKTGNNRVELGAVLYEKNVAGIKGPRKMIALIPSIEEGKPYVFEPQPNCSSVMLNKYATGFDRDKMIVMRNKLPRWNPELGVHCLKFQGRPALPSVKNFQLVTDADENCIVLQFGKAGKNVFTMDYQYPMSALQAFAICLSSLDKKLACD